MSRAIHTENRKHLGIGALIALVLVYLVILQGGGQLLSAAFGIDAEYATFPDIESLLAGITIPVALSVVLVIAVISVLRWWKPVMSEDRRVNRWIWFIPVLTVLAAFAMIDYSNLADIDTSLVLLLIGGSILVGIGEELMFRGVAVVSMRESGMTEARVALWSSLLFGGVHITNIITEGPKAFGQVVAVSIAGFFFYLMRRVSGTILVPMAVHALWDFSLFSSSVGPDSELNARSGIGIVLNIIIGIILLVRRHHIGIDNGDPLADQPSAPATA